MMFTVFSLFDFILTIEKLLKKTIERTDNEYQRFPMFTQYNNSVLADLFNFSGFSIIEKVFFPIFLSPYLYYIV